MDEPTVYSDGIQIGVSPFTVTLGFTVLSGADYFYRFFLSTGFKALVKDRERWP